MELTWFQSFAFKNIKVIRWCCKYASIGGKGETVENVLKTISGVIGALASFLWGGWSMLIQVLLVLIIIDYVMAILVAGYLGELNSKMGFRGIFKKVMMLLLVAVGHLVDVILIGDKHLVRDAVTFFYIANEMISILETVGRTNLPIPSILKKAVKTLSDKSKNHE